MFHEAWAMCTGCRVMSSNRNTSDIRRICFVQTHRFKLTSTLLIIPQVTKGKKEQTTTSLGKCYLQKYSRNRNQIQPPR